MTTERMTGFDALRFFLVVCVIAMHAAMTYMAYVPTYWYVKDGEQSLVFTLLVIFLDSFPMSALFFLAGYFAAPSFNKRGKQSKRSKRGAADFLRGKFMRIGVPWILGVLLAAPFFAHASYRAYGLPPIGAFEFLTTAFFGVFYQQGHYWFLGTLFFFMVVYALIAKRTGLNVKDEGPSGAQPLLALVFVLSVLSYGLSGRYIKPVDEWLSIGYVIYFQPAKIAGYTGLFACGAWGWKRGWFKPGGWLPNTALWGVAAIVSSGLLLVVKLRPWQETERLTALITESLCYNGEAIAMTLFLSSLFLKKAAPLHRLTAAFEGDSYSIYWLHQIILMPMLYLIKPLELSIYLKWALSIPITVLLCFALSKFILKKTPLWRKVFSGTPLDV